MITHDKRGKPLHPTVQEILNLEVPVLSKRRKAPTVRSRGPPRAPPQKVPNLAEVPALESESGSEVSPKSSNSENITIVSSPDAETEPVEPESTRLSLSPPKALEWLRSLLVGTAPSFSEKLELEAQLAAGNQQKLGPPVEPTTQPTEQTQQTQTQQTEQVARALPTLSMNSAFYRVLALETQMCLRGKLDAPNVAMALPRERGPRRRREWVDLAQACN